MTMALIKPKRQTTGQTPQQTVAPACMTSDLLGHDDPAECRAALRAIASLATDEAELRIPVLAARLVLEENEATLELLLTTLVRIGTPAAVAAVLPLMRLEDARLRNAAIEALRQMPPASVAPEIPALLQDGDPDIRIFTVQLIGRVEHPDRARWLNGILRDEPEKNVCLAAVEALAERYTREADEALQALPARFHDDPFVEFSVVSVRALHRFGEG